MTLLFRSCDKFFEPHCDPCSISIWDVLNVSQNFGLFTLRYGTLKFNHIQASLDFCYLTVPFAYHMYKSRRFIVFSVITELVRGESSVYDKELNFKDKIFEEEYDNGVVSEEFEPIWDSGMNS